MANRFLSPGFWPWRLGVAVGLPWLFRFAPGPDGAAPRRDGRAGHRVPHPHGHLRLRGAARGLLRWMEGRTLRETGLFGRDGLVRRFAEGTGARRRTHRRAQRSARRGRDVRLLPAGECRASSRRWPWRRCSCWSDSRRRCATARSPSARWTRAWGACWPWRSAAPSSAFPMPPIAGATPMSIAAIAVGGVFLAACYLRYRSLWVPIGFHFAWNTMIGVVLGLPISGTEIPALLHAESQPGPTSGPVVASAPRRARSCNRSSSRQRPSTSGGWSWRRSSPRRRGKLDVPELSSARPPAGR